MRIRLPIGTVCVPWPVYLTAMRMVPENTIFKFGLSQSIRKAFLKAFQILCNELGMQLPKRLQASLAEEQINSAARPCPLRRWQSVFRGNSETGRFL